MLTEEVDMRLKISPSNRKIQAASEAVSIIKNHCSELCDVTP